MSKTLVIVESPTKARTITRFLGGSAKVLASMGHIRDLPQRSLSIDLHNGFMPQYQITPKGKRVVADLLKEAKGADDIYLAPDPDREGEAIAWHLAELLRPKSKARFHRVTFHEITKDAIRHAFETPGSIDQNKVDAQQARRVLDRIVGYQVSPMLWRKVQKGTSAGRVQSVALRLICERQREIDNFKPLEHWTLEALFHSRQPDAEFTTRLVQLDGKKLPFDNKVSIIPDAATANRLAAELERPDTGYRISRVASTPKFQRAAAPFITSTLQQAAGSNLSMGSGRTMRLAQDLYEGVDIGDGPVGLITYMRTDSFEVAKEAQAAAHRFITTTFGAEYAPAKPNIYRSRASAQGAHEAIRPTDITLTPERLAGHLAPDQLRLYRLIWNRFIASQMSPAKLVEDSIEVEAAGANLTHQYLFRTSASRVVFPGFRKVYDFKETESSRPGDEEEEVPQNRNLPALPEGTACDLRNLGKNQKFTEPPKQFSEAMLVKELEQNGIGRPSTYASIVETIQTRDYVTKEKGRLTPTALGHSVNDFLVAQLPDLFQVGFTADMETRLDEIEEGKVGWQAMLGDFYEKFQAWSGGAAAAGVAPPNEDLLVLLKAFPANLNWKEPEKRGRKTYDDKAFHESLLEQVSGGKPFSEKQWQAALALVARYAAQAPVLLETIEPLGARPQVEELIKQQAEPREERVAAHAADDVAPLIAAMKKIDWEAPAKRGRKVYDDKKFYKSLARQIDDGSGFSAPQMEALRKLAVKYQSQLPTFADLDAKFQLLKPVAANGADGAAAPAVDHAQLDALCAMIGEVTQWAEPTQRKGWTFDDKKFADSIRDQYTKRRSLSPKQVDATLKLLRKYKEQISGFAERCAACGLPAEPPKPQAVDAHCPDCGAQLLQRSFKGRTFFGCSGYPKCKFSVSSLDKLAPKGE